MVCPGAQGEAEIPRSGLPGNSSSPWLFPVFSGGVVSEGSPCPFLPGERGPLQGPPRLEVVQQGPKEVQLRGQAHEPGAGRRAQGDAGTEHVGDGNCCCPWGLVSSLALPLPPLPEGCQPSPCLLNPCLSNLSPSLLLRTHPQRNWQLFYLKEPGKCRKETQVQIVAYYYLLSIYYMPKNQIPFPDEDIDSEMPSYFIKVLG